MSKKPKSQKHQNEPKRHNHQAGKKESASDMGTAPRNQSSRHPKRDRDNSDYSPTPGQVLRCLVRWFRGFHFNREKPKATDWLTVGLTLLVAGAALWSAWVFQGQLDAAQNQLTEAQKATKVAKRTARLSQRPWIGLSDEAGGGLITTPLTLDEHGNVSMVVRTRVKNFGSYGAQGVSSNPQLIVGQSPNEADSHQLCKGIPDALGFTVYPGKTTEWNEYPESYPANQIKVDRSGQTTAFIVGCIAFRDQFDCHYDIRFGYRFVYDRFGNNVPLYFKPAPKSTPAGHFALYSSEMDSPPCPEQDE